MNQEQKNTTSPNDGSLGTGGGGGSNFSEADRRLYQEQFFNLQRQIISLTDTIKTIGISTTEHKKKMMKFDSRHVESNPFSSKVKRREHIDLKEANLRIKSAVNSSSRIRGSAYNKQLESSPSIRIEVKPVNPESGSPDDLGPVENKKAGSDSDDHGSPSDDDPDGDSNVGDNDSEDDQNDHGPLDGDSDGGNDSDGNKPDQNHKNSMYNFQAPKLQKKLTTGLGLFGESSTQTVFTELPKLTSESSTDFHVWKHNVLTYFSNNGLLQVVTMSTGDAFQTALWEDGGQMLPETIRGKFIRLNVKAWGLLYNATIKVLHQSFFDNIGKVGVINYIGYEPLSPAWMADFRYGNASILWKAILAKLDDGQSIDGAKTLTKLLTFRYKMGSNPSTSMEYWENIIRELEASKMPITPKMQTLFWMEALPPEMESFKLSLAGQKNIDFRDIYDQLEKWYRNHYRGLRSKGQGTKSEVGAAGLEGSQKRENPDKGKTCEHCGKKDHIQKNCWKLHPEKLPEIFKNRKPFNKSDQKETSGKKIPEIAACGIEFELEPKEEIAAFFDTEQAYGQRERMKSVLPPEFTALFDSAATSHVVNDERLLHDIRDVPEVCLTGIVSGAKAVIRKGTKG